MRTTVLHTADPGRLVYAVIPVLPWAHPRQARGQQGQAAWLGWSGWLCNWLLSVRLTDTELLIVLSIRLPSSKHA